METIVKTSEASLHSAHWRIQYDSDIRAVRAYAMPGFRFDAMPEFCTRIQEFSRRMRCARVVVDYTQAASAPALIDHAGPALDSASNDIARNAEIAFVFDKLDAGRVHAGRVLRERGFNVAVFSDEWAAIEWLN
jgi:hypothetical protein